MRYLLFRHGETDWNAQQRFQGHVDVPLNEWGRQQARLLVPLLARHGIEAVLSSDLARAAETARIVAEELHLPFHLDRRLREAHLGDAQGMTRAEIEARFGEELVTRWRSSHVADLAYAGGESARDVLARVRQALADFARAGGFERVGVATHGGVIRRLAHSLLPAGSSPVPIPNGVVYELHVDIGSGTWTLLR